MMLDICDSMRDCDFRTVTNTHQHSCFNVQTDCVRNRNYRAAVVCLVLLCVLLLTAVIVLCVHIHTNYTTELWNTNYTEETNQLLTKITNLTEEREQLLTTIKTEKKELLSKNDNLIKQSEQLNKERNSLRKLLETERWKCHQSSLYYFSLEKSSWTESRRYCTEREADLIIINNRDEQDFVQKWSDNNRAWIGLTDIDVEGRWKWVDGSTLTSGYWRLGEPNGRSGENCTLSHSSGWADYPCNDKHRWICERNIFK
ncbi:uncharacterized protein [Garra rufa]|uniref:uncharacterized protein n=1 Tax=Garra rufa TaxID=137080 RepID=UPI003CCEC0E7